jgi:hypothetical protein
MAPQETLFFVPGRNSHEQICLRRKEGIKSKAQRKIIMATSSILGGQHLPEHVRGKDTNALGPSDNSDSGSDAQGAYGDDELSSDSDAAGTGERASVGPGLDVSDADILPDHIEGEDDESVSEAGDDDLETAADVHDLAADESDDDEDVE